MVTGPDAKEAMFLTFLVLLAAGAIVPIALFSSAEILGLTSVTRWQPAFGSVPMRRAASSGWALTQGYVWLGWAAYCTWVGLHFVLDPAVNNPWVYVALSILATTLPIAYLRVRDRPDEGSDEERRDLQRGSNVWRVVVLSSCICFWIAPQLMSVPYGWFAHFDPNVPIEGLDVSVAPLASPGHIPGEPPAFAATQSTGRDVVADAKTSMRTQGTRPQDVPVDTACGADEEGEADDDGEDGRGADRQAEASTPCSDNEHAPEAQREDRPL